MLANPKFKPYIKRLVIVVGISLLVVAIFNEVAYRFQREAYDRNPQTIDLVIPAGTSLRVAAGEKEPSIPDQIVFVKGDTLVVRNEDSVSHQMGPIWVPAGATGRLTMDEPTSGAYSCSFTPSRYLSIDVRQPTTLAVRLTALMIGGPTVAALAFLYSLLLLPLDRKKAPVITQQAQGEVK